MREILTVTYAPQAKEREDQRYTSYDSNFDISEELKPQESSEVLGLYLTIIDNARLIVRAMIGSDHNAILQGIKDNETLMGMQQKLLIPGYTSDQTTLVNEAGEEKPTSGLSLIKTFNEACHLVLAINDGLLNEIPRHDRIVMIGRGDHSNFLNTGSLKNIARIFADKI